MTIRAVPLPLRQQNLQILIPELIGYGADEIDAVNIAQWLARHLASDHPQWSGAGYYPAGRRRTALSASGEVPTGWFITTC